MERGNTKQEIINAAMELFSTQGFEATSISQIADAVGIRKASLYNHFASKQDILDTLLGEALERYVARSIFANADWENPEYTKGMENISPDTATEMILNQVGYILHDPEISKGRKMLTIEQFRNEKMADIQTKRNYTDVLFYFTGLVGFLVRSGKLKDMDCEIMAAQLCLPITVWINLCDREPEREREVLGLIERHIRQFFRIYGK